MNDAHVVVIGAGVGGLTTAALLLNAGHRVTVLEAHIYRGGCAGAFYHQGYRFDAGATLAGGFAPGGPHARVAELLNLEWPVRPVDPAWVVHLPDRTTAQWAEAERWRAERQTAFPGAERFWRTQESLADIVWDVSSRPFPWPPQSAREWAVLALALRSQSLRAAPYLFSTIGDLTPESDPSFKTFLDAQLLISAQTTSERAHALYGGAALDSPRRGVNHVHGGIGGLAKTLADWIRARGGEGLYRQRIERIEVKDGRAIAARTDKDLSVECDALIANLTPWA
jgi:phytoene dehydrogenase-like protein